MEKYRSGHNEAVLKTVCPKGRMGSNPIFSVRPYSSYLRWKYFCIYGQNLTVVFIRRSTQAGRRDTPGKGAGR